MDTIRETTEGECFVKHYHQLIRHSGNSNLFKAIEMSIAALANGMPLHIHAEGLRGTGKTTILRSVRELLPPIIRIKNCIYNCHPQSPHCPQHHQLSREEIEKIGTEVVPCPFLEISHAANIGTVVGSIDLGKLISPDSAMAAILPGTIPQAHRGIIFIDEINRLADTSPELADVLLDVMGTKPGHIQIEETGLATVELPVNVTIWAASNPDEEPGALMRIRKQLADRFDFGITMGKPSDYQAVFNILEQRNKQQSAPYDRQFHTIADRLSDIIIEDPIRTIIARIYIDFDLESLRAIETMEIAASLSCLMAGRKKVEVDDIADIVPMALAHRIDSHTITNILQYLQKSNYNEVEQVANVKQNCSRVGIAASNKVQEQDEKMNLWEKMMNRLRNTMNFFNRLKKRISSQGVGAGTEIVANGNVKIMDPANSNIVAPRKKATPMKELPVEEFLKSNDYKQHDE